MFRNQVGPPLFVGTLRRTYNGPGAEREAMLAGSIASPGYGWEVLKAAAEREEKLRQQEVNNVYYGLLSIYAPDIYSAISVFMDGNVIGVTVEGHRSKGGSYDWGNAKTTLDYTGGIFGGLATTVRPGNQWLGKNGKYYNMSWGGNQYAGGRSGAVKAANFYKAAGRVTVAATVIIGGIETYNGYQMDGGKFGYNASNAAAQTVGGIGGGFGGAALGAQIGAGIGVWFGGVGAVPGAAIGGFIGGILGGWGGSSAGGAAVDWYYGR